MIDEHVERFFWWINERHWIYLQKDAGDPWPWTDDPILQTYKFTNVFRELDTGTVWYRENWREPFAHHPKLFFNTCLYRQFNYWPTAEFLGFIEHDGDELVQDPNEERWWSIWYPEHIENALRERKQSGMRVFTGAHMLTGTLGGPEKKDKVWQVVWRVLDHIWHNEELYIPQPGDTLEKAYKRLLPAPGFGPFLSYEVITDLRHTRYLEDASDIMTWANPGPGAVRGIHRLFGFPLVRGYHAKMIKGVDYVQHMRELLVMSPDYLEDHVPDLEMRDIEHSLCEFDKYERTRTGHGRPRSKYVYKR